MTPPQIAERLKTAGLLAVAERVAKRHDLLVKHVLEFVAEPTQGHVALWTTLAKEGQSPAQIASLLGWPESVIRRALPVPEARPTPVPESGRRPTIKKAAPRKKGAVQPRPIERRVRILGEEIGALRVALGRLVARVDQLLPKSEQASADAVRIRNEVAVAHGLGVKAVCGDGRSARISLARRHLIDRLTEELCWSERQVAEFIGRDRSTVLYHLRGGRKAAA